MEILPAIDLRGGRCVRLTKGDYARETVYDEDPVAVARKFKEAGARRLHVVDLDGARAGSPVHLEVLYRMASAARLSIEYGGGLRELDHVRAAVTAGASRVILGTAAFRAPDMLREAIALFPGKVLVSIDARGMEVLASGWTETLKLGVVESFRAMSGQGVTGFIYTDTGRDGTLEGADAAGFEALLRKVDNRKLLVQFAGGVRDLEDIKALRRLEPLGLTGVIAGKSLYEGTLDLAGALAVARGFP